MWPALLSPVTKVRSSRPSTPRTDRENPTEPPGGGARGGRASTSPRVGVYVPLCSVTPLLYLSSPPTPCPRDPPWLQLGLRVSPGEAGPLPWASAGGRGGALLMGLLRPGGARACVSVCVCMYGQLLTHTAQLTLYPEICFQ